MSYNTDRYSLLLLYLANQSLELYRFFVFCVFIPACVVRLLWVDANNDENLVRLVLTHFVSARRIAYQKLVTMVSYFFC